MRGRPTDREPTGHEGEGSGRRCRRIQSDKRAKWTGSRGSRKNKKEKRNEKKKRERNETREKEMKHRKKRG